MNHPPSPPLRTDVPLLYGASDEDSEPVPLVTPSEDEMARFLGQQMAAAVAAESAVGPASVVTPDVTESDVMAPAAVSAPPRVQPGAQGLRFESMLPRLHDDDVATRLPSRPTEPATSADLSRAVQAGPAPQRPLQRPAQQDPALPLTAPALRQIGRFTGLKRQGRTEAGTLYRATDPKTSHEVAVHVLHGPACDREQLRPLLVQQLQAAARLSHPNIAVVDEVGVDDGQPFLVGPAGDGETLPQRLQTQGPLSIRDTVLLGLQMARALEHAHSRGMLHGDLKPSNVLVGMDGQTIQLTGFGIATPAHAPPMRPGAGTRQYMTPEQTRGEPQDARSDVFAAGVVLYEMLTGERPFRGSTPLALATRIASEDPSPLLVARPDVPPVLRRTVERCLSKAPALRYASAAALADALLRVLNEIETAELQDRRPSGLSLRTRWAALSGLAAALLVGAAAAGAAAWQLDAVQVHAGEQGRSLARFVAAQHAEQVLAEDWDAVASQLLPAAQAWGSDRLAIVDAAGIVRVSSDPALVGQTFGHGAGAWTPARADGTRARQVGTRMEFGAPIQIQGKDLGRVFVGLPETTMTKSAESTAWLFGWVAAVAALVAAVVAYGLASRLAGPINKASDSLNEIARGRFDQRMPESRVDEFGRLFTAIDAMALALQRRESGREAPPRTDATPPP